MQEIYFYIKDWWTLLVIVKDQSSQLVYLNMVVEVSSWLWKKNTKLPSKVLF